MNSDFYITKTSATMPRLMHFHLQARVVILLSASLTSISWLLAPHSLPPGAGESYGHMLVHSLFAAVVLFGWADVVVNDFMPPKYTFNFLRHRRHLLFSVIGMLFMLKAFVGGGSLFAGSWPLFSYYVLMGVCCLWYVFSAVLRADHAL
jgi:hypothetical protein